MGLNIEINNLIPTCAICNKKVDSIEWQTDFVRNINIARVECHGASEVAELSKELISDSSNISAGFAFSNSLLEAGKKIMLEYKESIKNLADK